MSEAQPRLLLVMAVPPPVTGQAMAAAMLLEHLDAIDRPYEVVNLSRPFYTDGALRGLVRRVGRSLEFPVEALRKMGLDRRTPTVCYLQLGQSGRALMRDLPVLALARAMGWRVVVHVHGGLFRVAFDGAPAPMRLALRRALRRVDRAIVLSDRLRALFADLVPPERVVAVDNGVDAELGAAAAGFERPAPGAALTCVFLTNLIASKGYMTVCRAAALARDRGLPHRFVLAGYETEYMDGHPRDFIAAHGLTNLAWRGGVTGDAKLDLLRQSDVFVLPVSNPTEGIPIALLEAMHFGLPLVATQAGGLGDLVVDGANGFVVPPDDPAALLAAVERLTDAPTYARISAHNVAEARARFTGPAHGAAVLAVLDAAAQGPMKL